MTSLTASFGDSSADATPAMLPDLYRGEPLVIAAKLGGLTGTSRSRG